MRLLDVSQLLVFQVMGVYAISHIVILCQKKPKGIKKRKVGPSIRGEDSCNEFSIPGLLEASPEELKKDLDLNAGAPRKRLGRGKSAESGGGRRKKGSKEKYPETKKKRKKRKGSYEKASKSSEQTKSKEKSSDMSNDEKKSADKIVEKYDEEKKLEHLKVTRKTDDDKPMEPVSRVRKSDNEKASAEEEAVKNDEEKLPLIIGSLEPQERKLEDIYGLDGQGIPSNATEKTAIDMQSNTVKANRTQSDWYAGRRAASSYILISGTGIVVIADLATPVRPSTTISPKINVLPVFMAFTTWLLILQGSST